jgi:polyhydroxybutyrate depolymerase
MERRRLLAGLAMVTIVAGTASACADGGSGEGAAGTTTTVAPACDRPATAGLAERTMQSGGEDRQYLLYVPESYSGTEAVPLVVNLHGSGSSGEEQLSGSELQGVADEHGFVVVAPDAGIIQTLADGTASTTGGVWNVPGVVLTDGSAAAADAPDDVAFLEELVDATSQELCISTVVATGTSGGGRMSSALGCASDRFDVIAPVAGIRFPEGCVPRRPVDVVAFHGTADRVNPFGGGGAVYWGAQTVPQAAAGWAAAQGCVTGPIDEEVSASVTRSMWTGCTGGVTVTLYTVDGGGHAWPGGADAAAAHPEFAAIIGATTQEIDAGQLIWEVASVRG